MTAPQKGRIFISYRRVDSAGYAGRIYDRLAAHFGKDALFMDVDTIEAGLDFVEVLENAVQSCDVLVALIGRQWLNIKDAAGKRRLDNPEDFVRIEVAAALSRKIRVIPVLVDGTTMPNSEQLPSNLKSLARRNAVPVNHYSFHNDANRLIEQLELALNAAEESKTNVSEQKADKLVSSRQSERLFSLKEYALEKIERLKQFPETFQSLSRPSLEKKGIRARLRQVLILILELILLACGPPILFAILAQFIRINILVLFWGSVVLLGVLGFKRGMVKESLVSFCIIIALAFTFVLSRYIPLVAVLPEDSPSLFWIRTPIVELMAYLGYKAGTNIPHIFSNKTRERPLDKPFGIIMGAVNGYLIFGSVLFYLHIANYLFPAISLTGDFPTSVQKLMNWMPPHLVGEPGIYFVVFLAFLFEIIILI